MTNKDNYDRYDFFLEKETDLSCFNLVANVFYNTKKVLNINILYVVHFTTGIENSF